jgi:hypothetical protein
VLTCVGAAEILGQVVFVTRAGSVPTVDPASSFAFFPLTETSPQSIYLNGQLTGFRESIDITNLTSSSPPHLALQYLQIFVARLSPHSMSSTDILGFAQRLLGNLTSGAITPLHHMFASLVATSFTELSDRVETQVEAHAGIKEMDDALSNGQIVHRSLDGTGWDTAIRDVLHQKKVQTPPPTGPEHTSPAPQPNMVGLQHLAAAAVGEREGSEARPTSSGGNGSHSQSSKVEHDLSAAMAAANEAAMAQATAAAAQQQMSASPGGTSGGNLDANGLKQDGFMASLS